MKVCIELLLDWHPRDWPPLKIDLNDCHEEITASSSQIPSNPSKFLEKGCINKKSFSNFLGWLVLTVCIDRMPHKSHQRKAR